MPLSPIIAGHLLEVKVYTYFAGQLGVNVIHMKINTATMAPTPADIVGQVEADWNGSWKSWMNVDARWKGVGIRDLTVDPLEVESFSGAQEGPGTAGDPLPGQLAGLITKRTAIAGPKGRGRMYLPFPGQDNLGAVGAVSVGALAVMAALVSDIKGPETETAGGFAINWTLVLRTPKVGGDPYSSTPLTFIGPESHFATQRRRGAFGTLNQLPGPLQ